MERLTTNLNGTIYFAKGRYSPTTICAEMENWEVRECMTKLAEYEDTGLVPEETKDMNDILNENNEGTVSEEMLRIIIELAQYKKTGLTPKQILEISDSYGAQINIANEFLRERDYWKNEAKKFASELGEIKLGNK